MTTQSQPPKTKQANEENVKLAIKTLQENGAKISAAAVADLAGLSRASIYHFDSFREFIRPSKRHQQNRNNNLNRVSNAITSLTRNGQRASLANVIQQSGLSRATVVEYWKALRTKDMSSEPLAHTLSGYIEFILESYFFKSEKLSEVREDMLAEHADFDNALFERAISKLRQDGILKPHTALPGYFMQNLPHEQPKAPVAGPSIFDIGSSWIVGRPHEEFPVEEDSEPPVAPTKAKSFLILDQFMNVHDYEGDDTIDDTLKSLLEANRDIRLTVYRPVKTAHLIPEIQSL